VRITAGTDGTSVVFEAVRRLDDAKIWIEDFALHKPTLDDVFLALTGHAAEDVPDDDVLVEEPKKRRGRRQRKEKEVEVG
jgi:ABC-2 type transport system ATP-binding protein